MNINTLSEVQRSRLLPMLRMPMYFDGLVMENTNRCNSKCAICYQSAGGNHCTSRIDLTAAKSCIEQAALLENVGTRFHLAGGEAFLYPEDCFTLFGTAKEAGFTFISATSNCVWGSTPEKARYTCSRLRENGVVSLELSWDYWHGEFIPPAWVENCLIACNEYDISTNLRVLTTRHHSMQEALSRLDPQALRLVHFITSGPVFATGRAAEVLPSEEFYSSRAGLEDACHAILNLTVNVYGEVFPCCAGFEMCRSCAFGNIHEEPLEDIVIRMNNDAMLRQLVFLGPASFLPLLEEKGCKINTEQYSICQLCSTIFSNPDCRKVIREEFQHMRKTALESVLSNMEKRMGGVPS